MPKNQLLTVTFWIGLFISLSFAFNNCSGLDSIKPNATEGTGGGNANRNDIVTNCVIQDFNNSSIRTNSGEEAFGSGKLIVSENANDDYVSLVDPACLENTETRTRSRFTARMGLQDGPDGHRVWAQKIRRLDLPEDMQELRNELEEDPCLMGLAPNRRYEKNLVEADFDDTFIPQMGHLDSISYFRAMETFYDENLGLKEGVNDVRVRVAVIDTGLHYTHVDIAENVYTGPNGIGVDANTLGTGNVNYDGVDVDGAVSHGTHVSGIIAARGANGVGVTGIAPQSAQILPINVFYEDPNDAGVVISDTATLIQGINFAIAQNADVINMSLGGGGADPALLSALISAVNNGIFVVAAAANENRELGANYQSYPAFYARQISGMVAVGSINAINKTKSSFSNYGPDYVEIAAPGSESEQDGDITGIASLLGPGNYARLYGTSQAAPMVAGAAALAEGLIRQNGYSITPSQMERLLVASAEKHVTLAGFFRGGNVLNLERLAAFVNANYDGTGITAYNAICQSQ